MQLERLEIAETISECISVERTPPQLLTFLLSSCVFKPSPDCFFEREGGGGTYGVQESLFKYRIIEMEPGAWRKYDRQGGFGQGVSCGGTTLISLSIRGTIGARPYSAFLHVYLGPSLSGIKCELRAGARQDMAREPGKRGTLGLFCKVLEYLGN